MHFNTAIQSLPWVLVARPLGFRAKEFFSAEGDTAAPRGVVHAGDVTLQQQIRRNRLKSGIVVVGFVVLLGVVAGLIGAVLDLRLGVVGAPRSGPVRDLRDHLVPLAWSRA